MLQCYNVTMFYMHFFLLMRGQVSVRGGTYKCPVFPQRRAQNIQDLNQVVLFITACTDTSRKTSLSYLSSLKSQLHVQKNKEIKRRCQRKEYTGQSDLQKREVVLVNRRTVYAFWSSTERLVWTVYVHDCTSPPFTVLGIVLAKRMVVSTLPW